MSADAAFPCKKSPPANIDGLPEQFKVLGIQGSMVASADAPAQMLSPAQGRDINPHQLDMRVQALSKGDIVHVSKVVPDDAVKVAKWSVDIGAWIASFAVYGYCPSTGVSGFFRKQHLSEIVSYVSMSGELVLPPVLEGPCVATKAFFAAGYTEFAKAWFPRSNFLLLSLKVGEVVTVHTSFQPCELDGHWSFGFVSGASGVLVAGWFPTECCVPTQNSLPADQDIDDDNCAADVSLAMSSEATKHVFFPPKGGVAMPYQVDDGGILSRIIDKAALSLLSKEGVQVNLHRVVIIDPRMGVTAQAKESEMVRVDMSTRAAGINHFIEKFTDGYHVAFAPVFANWPPLDLTVNGFSASASFSAKLVEPQVTTDITSSVLPSFVYRDIVKELSSGPSAAFTCDFVKFVKDDFAVDADHVICRHSFAPPAAADLRSAMTSDFIKAFPTPDKTSHMAPSGIAWLGRVAVEADEYFVYVVGRPHGKCEFIVNKPSSPLLGAELVRVPAPEPTPPPPVPVPTPVFATQRCDRRKSDTHLMCGYDCTEYATLEASATCFVCADVMLSGTKAFGCQTCCRYACTQCYHKQLVDANAHYFDRALVVAPTTPPPSVPAAIAPAPATTTTTTASSTPVAKRTIKYPDTANAFPSSMFVFESQHTRKPKTGRYRAILELQAIDLGQVKSALPESAWWAMCAFNALNDAFSGSVPTLRARKGDAVYLHLSSARVPPIEDGPGVEVLRSNCVICDRIHAYNIHGCKRTRHKDRRTVCQVCLEALTNKRVSLDATMYADNVFDHIYTSSFFTDAFDMSTKVYIIKSDPASDGRYIVDLDALNKLVDGVKASLLATKTKQAAYAGYLAYIGIICLLAANDRAVTVSMLPPPPPVDPPAVATRSQSHTYLAPGDAAAIARASNVRTIASYALLAAKTLGLPPNPLQAYCDDFATLSSFFNMAGTESAAEAASTYNISTEAEWRTHVSQAGATCTLPLNPRLVYPPGVHTFSAFRAHADNLTGHASAAPAATTSAPSIPRTRRPEVSERPAKRARARYGLPMMTYDEASAYVSSQLFNGEPITTSRQFYSWTKVIAKPDSFPANPYLQYNGKKGTNWWSRFLQRPAIDANAVVSISSFSHLDAKYCKPNQPKRGDPKFIYPTLAECLVHAKKSGIMYKKQWQLTLDHPDCIRPKHCPADPQAYYKIRDNQWIKADMTWQKFLCAKPKRKRASKQAAIRLLPYSTIHKFTAKVSTINSKADYAKWWHEKKPDGAPEDPEAAYPNEFPGWNEFVGVDTVADMHFTESTQPMV